MDRFSEQLIKKEATGKDMFIRGLDIAAAMALIAALIFAFAFIGIVSLAVAAAVIWGTVWLLQGTSVEYEYIVTNDDLDIDKIIGKRKRKRLVTLSLREAKELGEYVSGTELNAEVAVMAHDETGIDMYYFICGSKEYGSIAVVFNPDKRTLYNMIGGFSGAVKKKYLELYEKLAPAVEETDEEQDNVTESAEETTDAAVDADNASEE